METCQKSFKNSYRYLSPEIDFVLLCACVEPDDERRDRIIEDAANADLDWDLVYRISLQQRVLPILFENIKSLLRGMAPNRIFKKLQDIYLNNTIRNLSFTLFLSNTLILLEENGVFAIPFKGPVLAQEIYGDIGLRPISDLDILVSKKDAVVAWEILLKDRFLPLLEINDRQKHVYIRSEDHMVFFNGSMHVELHWKILGNYLHKPIMLENLRKGLRKVIINNREVPDLSSEHLLLYLCVHGANHGWEHLERVCSVAEVIKKKSINWEIVEKMASDWQCQKMFALGIYLSWKLLEAPIPENVLNEIKKDKNVSKLVEEVVAFMFSKFTNITEAKNITARFSSFHIRVRDSLLDKLRYVLRLALCPTIKEWQYFPVPASFTFLYYFLRPYRLMKAGLKRNNGVREFNANPRSISRQV